jgi:hypothetical protein
MCTQVLDSYVNARNWDDLVTAVHKSTLGFPADKLVELCHENEVSAPQTPVLNVERVTYKHIHDILGLLNHASPSESVCGLAYSSKPRSSMY